MEKVKSPTYSPEVVEEVDLDDVLSRLVAKWKILFAACLIGALAAFFVSRSLPKVYEAKATIYVQDNSPATSLMRDLPLSLGQSSGGSSGYLVTLLQSDSMLRNVILKLHLTTNKAYAKKGRASVDSVLQSLKKSVFVDEDKIGGISVVVRASNADRAASIANAMLDNLGSSVVTNSKQKAQFISAKLAETDRDLRKAEEELLEFQQRHDIASIDEETKGMIEQLGTLDAQSVATNMELQQVESELANGGDLNALVDLEVRKKSLQSTKTYLAQEMGKLQHRIASLPAFAIRYARLQREIGVLSKTFELLTEQLQLANISQHGENGDYQIIDRAAPNYKSVLPHVMLNTAVGGLLGIVAPACLVLAFGKSGRKRRAKF